jgi:hypothetical protein
MLTHSVLSHFENTFLKPLKFVIEIFISVFFNSWSDGLFNFLFKMGIYKCRNMSVSVVFIYI